MKNKTLLLVEDDFLNRRISKRILLENDYNVLEAKNAEEALTILKKEIIDLVVLDINLGEKSEDGISVGQFIKEKLNIPFIYLTAYENQKIIERAVETTPYSYLTKPFKRINLITSVEIALRQSANQQKFKPTILVKDRDYNVELPIDVINYVESEGNYLLFHSEKKIYKSRSTIKQLLEVLPQNTFTQVHRAYVVNKTKIEKFNLKNLIINDREIPVSKNYIHGISLNIMPEKESCDSERIRTSDQ